MKILFLFLIFFPIFLAAYDVSDCPNDWIRPGDITTVPNKTIVFHGPFTVFQHTYHFKLINTSPCRIVYRIYHRNARFLSVDPTAGVLDPKEAVLIQVALDYESRKDASIDPLTIHYAKTHFGARKQYQSELFDGGRVTGRHKLYIEIGQ